MGSANVDVLDMDMFGHYSKACPVQLSVGRGYGFLTDRRSRFASEPEDSQHRGGL